jgi:hypothetical protein
MSDHEQDAYDQAYKAGYDAELEAIVDSPASAMDQILEERWLKEATEILHKAAGAMALHGSDESIGRMVRIIIERKLCKHAEEYAAENWRAHHVSVFVADQRLNEHLGK